MLKNADITMQNKRFLNGCCVSHTEQCSFFIRSKLYDEDTNGVRIYGDHLSSTLEIPGFKHETSSATTGLYDSPPKKIKSTILASTLKDVTINAMRETVDKEERSLEETGAFCLVTLQRGLSACLLQCHVVSPILGIKKVRS